MIEINLITHKRHFTGKNEHFWSYLPQNYDYNMPYIQRVTAAVGRERGLGYSPPWGR